MKAVRSLSVAVFVSAGFVGHLQADTPLAYDGADHPAGPVQGVVSGVNFSAWQSQNANLTTYKYGAGLFFPWLQTTGNAVYGGGAYESAGVPVTTGAAAFDAYRSGTSLGADNTTLWASAIVNNLTGYDGVSFSLHNDGTAWAQGSGVRVVSQNGFWNVSDGTQTVSTGVKVDAGVSTLMVFKNEYLAGNDRTTLYINPTPGAALTQAGTAITSANLSFRASASIPAAAASRLRSMNCASDPRSPRSPPTTPAPRRRCAPAHPHLFRG